MHDLNDIFLEAEFMVVLILLLVIFLFRTREMEVKGIVAHLDAAELSFVAVLCFHKNLIRSLFDVEHEVVIFEAHGNKIGELLRIKEWSEDGFSDTHSIWHLYLSDYFELVDYKVIQHELVYADLD